MNKQLEKKIEKWSLGKNNRKFINPSADILRFIGSEMLLVVFNKDETGKWDSETPKPIFVNSIHDFDPMTGTYEIIYTLDKETKQERIIPEGFSFNSPEESGWMHRFLPYSLHFRILEEELYYKRLRAKYDSSEGVLPIEPLLIFKKSNQKETLGYKNYIAAVIDSDVEGGVKEGILSFRIVEITNITKKSKGWEMVLKDDSGNILFVNNYKNDENEGWICKGVKLDGTLLGDLKIMDIEDPKK